MTQLNQPDLLEHLPQLDNDTNRKIFDALKAQKFKTDKIIRLSGFVLNQDDIEALIAINTGNIPKSGHKIELYSDQMAGGLWQYNGDCIRTNKDGVLLDGQNRLYAAQTADYELCVDLIFGLPDNVFETIDTGRVRNSGHLLYREFPQLEKASDATFLARAVKKIMLHDAGYAQCAAIHKIKGGQFRITTTKMAEYVKKHPLILEQLNYVREHFDSDAVVPRATILYVYHIGSRFDQKYAAAWVAKTFGGENLMRDEACYHLYNFLRKVKQKTLRWTSAEIENTIIKTWNLVAKKGCYKINHPHNLKAKPDEKAYIMERPDENIRPSITRTFDE